jgi:hypothetical protein
VRRSEKEGEGGRREKEGRPSHTLTEKPAFMMREIT